MGVPPPELQRHYSVLNDDWEVDPVACRYQSPEPSAERPEQTLMFGHTIANGSFWADITPQKASRTQRDTFSMEAALVFRYTHPEAFYYAGISAFDTKFFAAKVLPGPYFQPRGYVGRRSSVLAGKTYHIRGLQRWPDHLYENEVQQFTVLDDAYVRGQLGLRTWRTQALFENVHHARSAALLRRDAPPRNWPSSIARSRRSSRNAASPASVPTRSISRVR